ncbi:MAG: hypothetical protein ABEK17_04080 [Candidatus Aenigmatarchaeota archaeon]
MRIDIMKRKQLIYLSILVGFLLLFTNTQNVAAIGNCSEGFKINNSETKEIDCQDMCKEVTNNNNNPIFVPTATSQEWNGFINNALNVNISNCTTCSSLATTCTEDSECCSGNCADGVCCDTSCTGSCTDCNLDGSEGTCTQAPETWWGDDLYDCSGNYYRCDSSGSCIECGGWISSDNCGGCSNLAGTSSNLACWYYGFNAGSNWGDDCITVCNEQSTGSCINTNWDDDTSCTVTEHFTSYACDSCSQRDNDFSPYAEDESNTCRYRGSSTNQDCDRAESFTDRVCVCSE